MQQKWVKILSTPKTSIGRIDTAVKTPELKQIKNNKKLPLIPIKKQTPRQKAYISHLKNKEK